MADSLIGQIQFGPDGKKREPVAHHAIEYRSLIQDSNDQHYVNRLLIGTATTGNVRIEWVNARYGQAVPCNWSMVQMLHYMNSFIPLRYQVADAQNLIVKEAVEKDFEWCLLLEHDVIMPPYAFLVLNQYMQEARNPIVSGLYFTRAQPCEPLIYRGKGTGYYADWKLGDKVWCDGVPTGMLLIHGSILQAMWKDSEEYVAGDVKTRRVFDSPRGIWSDPATGAFNVTSGTSDLAWCERVIKGDYFRKAGWSEFSNNRWPMLVDTRLLCGHIDTSGIQYPNNWYALVDEMQRTGMIFGEEGKRWVAK